MAGAIALTIVFYFSLSNVLTTKNLSQNIEKQPVGISAEMLRRMHFEKKQKNIPADKFKFDNPNEYFNYHWGIRTRKSETAPGYTQDYKVKELQKAFASNRYKSKQSLRTTGLPFIERGPANVPGRTRAILTMPQDPQKIWLAGAVGGGIWKTTDGGQVWVHKTPNMPSLAISWLDACKSNPNVIYASTGEANGAGVGIIGDGVFKSTDGGETWTQLASTAGKREFTFINRIIVDPNNPDVVLLCTSQGGWESVFRSEIYRSDDGGQTWQRVHQGDAWIYQIIANPMNFNTIYATSWGKGVLKSTDGGFTWFDSSLGFNKVEGRIELAIAPTDTSRIYAAAQGAISGTGSDLYVSYNAGAEWSYIEQKYDSKAVDFFRGQGDYDNTILVNPYNEDEVYYGGVSIWKTTMKVGTETGQIPVIDVKVAQGDFSIWDFVNFGADFFNGQLATGEDLTLDEFVDVEVRTGPGLKQMAHRFTVNKQGAGVPDSTYIYQDYVEVPFEVWDITNNKQLMVSFRDQQEDGKFNLIYQYTEDGDEANHSREYIYVHNVTYANTPNVNIATDGGIRHRKMYFFWPVLREGLSWDPVNLAVDTISIDYENLQVVKRFGDLTPVADAYEDYVENQNPAYADNTFTTFGFHPDHHNLVAIPLGEISRRFRILNANDGGVYISNASTSPGVNDGDWTYAGSTYNTGQFYSVAKKPGFDEYLGGLQDNGTWKTPKGEVASSTTNYEAVWGGDGFDVLWHYTNPKKMMISIYNNTFYRTEDEGRTWVPSSSGINGFKPFFSKLANSNSRPDAIYTVSSRGVYRSNDFGKRWSLTEITDQWGFTNFIDIKVSQANPDIIWAGSGISNDMKVHVSVDGGVTFSPTNMYQGAELGVLSGLATHPYQDSTAYVLFSFAGGPKILRTTDLGQTWEDISGFNSNSTSSNGFPDVAVYCLLVRPDNSDILWAGTEIGIFESIDNGQSWTFLNSDLGAAAVWDMNVMDDQVVIATHGRGIFTATLPATPEIVVVPEILATGTMLDGNLGVEVAFNSPYDSSFIYINGTEIGKYMNTQVGKGLITISGATVGDSLGISFVSYRNGKAYSATPTFERIFNVNAPTTVYVEDFNNGSDDFVGNGFTIATVNGFDNSAIHTEHPYPEGSGNPGDTLAIFYQLRTPIIVADKNAYIEYKDIAIVETGETGAIYPQESFYDYVVVEASDDGLHWQPLVRGYDANKDPAWLNAYNNEQDGDQSMFVKEKFDLLRYFNANDTIFIRFKLFSDPLTTGWGWSIDDLSIQNVITGIEEDDKNDLVLFPNPAYEMLNINYHLTDNSPVQIRIVNMQGQLVEKLAFGSQTAGEHRQQINISTLKPGLYVLNMDKEGKSFKRKLIIK